jgi:hypothetical protein
MPSSFASACSAWRSARAVRGRVGDSPEPERTHLPRSLHGQRRWSLCRQLRHQVRIPWRVLHFWPIGGKQSRTSHSPHFLHCSSSIPSASKRSGIEARVRLRLQVSIGAPQPHMQKSGSVRGLGPGIRYTARSRASARDSAVTDSTSASVHSSVTVPSAKNVAQPPVARCQAMRRSVSAACSSRVRETTN